MNILQLVLEIVTLVPLLVNVHLVNALLDT